MTPFCEKVDKNFSIFKMGYRHYYYNFVALACGSYLLFNIECVLAANVSTSCTIEQTGKLGKYERIQDCMGASRDKNNGTTASVCDFDEAMQMVCCPSESTGPLPSGKSKQIYHKKTAPRLDMNHYHRSQIGL